MREQSKKKIIYNIISFISAIVFVTASCMLLGERAQIAKTENEMKQYVNEDIVETDLDDSFNGDLLANKGKMKNPIDFYSLKEVNPDVYAWILVPGLDISYPILQSDIDNYYLWKNIDKYESRLGSIYTNKSVNATDFNDFNTIIYGHNVVDPSGNMFSPLHNLSKQEIFDKVDKIIIYTQTEKRVYDLYSVVRFYKNSYLPNDFRFDTDYGRDSFINMTFNDARYDDGKIREGIEVTKDDKLITLSTCMLDTNFRLLVIGKLNTIYPLESNVKVIKVDRLTK